MHPGHFIKDKRLALGFDPEFVAHKIGLNLPSYYDLEEIAGELQLALSLSEITKLERALALDVRAILGDWHQPTDITLPDLAELIGPHLQQSNQTVAEFENLIGWEVQPMLKSPRLALDWNLDCLEDVCTELGILWQSVNFEGDVDVTPESDFEETNG